MKAFPGTLPVFAILVTLATESLAKDDLGPIDQARAAWPAAFIPGEGVSADLAGEAFYAFAGEAESFFPDETENDLREEAVLDAKANFFASMTQGDRSRTVSMSGFRVAYHWREGGVFRVVCVVPRRSVSVSPANSSTTSPTPAAAAPTSTEASPGRTPTSLAGTEPSAPRKPRPNAGTTPLEDKIRAYRKRLADNPDDPLSRLELSRIFAQTGETGRAVRHYEALARKLAEKPSVMTDHEAAAAMVEAAEYAQSVGNEAKALKFYRVGWRRHDPELQQRITTAISLLRLHVD